MRMTPTNVLLLLLLLLCKIFIQHFSSAKKFTVINEIAVKSKNHKNFKNPKKFTIYIQYIHGLSLYDFCLPKTVPVTPTTHL